MTARHLGRWSGRVEWSRVALGTALALLAAGSARAAVVGPEVGRALRAAGRVRVVISLRLPEVAALAVGERTAGVAAAQSRVLDRLTADDFSVTARWQAVPGLAGEVSASGLEKLLACPEVDRVDLDRGGRAHLAASVPLIRANLVQAAGNTGQGITVAVLDSGATASHQDLSGDIVAEQCFCRTGGGAGCCPNGSTSQSGSGAARDDNGHGTNVTGIITSAGKVSAKGVAPGTKVVSVRVLAADGSFSGTSQVVSGLDFIINSHPEVKVVNLSLGTTELFWGDCDDTYSWTQTLASAINTLTARGTAVVASAGNDGNLNMMSAPACVAKTVSVGAVYKANVGFIDHSWAGCSDAATAADQVVCFSNSGGNLDLLAPGSPIISDGRSGGTSTYSGTSQASPHVAGVFALAFAAKPTATVAEILGAMTNTGVDVYDERNGMSFKRVDAKATVDALGGGSTTHTLSVDTMGTGTGTVTSSPAGISCGATCSAAFANGASVVLTATPASGSTFTGWGGACSGTGKCTVVMSQDRTVTATFAGGGGGGEYSTWVPVASHASGANLSQWRTDLGVLNAGDAQADLELRWYHSSGVKTQTTYVPAGSQSILEDVVAQIGSTTGSAALEVRSDQPVRVTSRTYNLVDSSAACYPDGTFGQDYPGVATTEGLSAGESAYLGQLSENAKYRCNIALLNTSTGTAEATVTLFDGDGSQLVSYSVNLAPGAYKQENRPFNAKAGQSNMSRGYARVTVTSGSGVFAMASVVDNATNDPTTIWMVR